MSPTLIVSGLPRSGTSMLMQMLAAGGVPIFCDDKRVADGSNPRGYFEHQSIAATLKSTDWLREASSKVAKVVFPLVERLPAQSLSGIIIMQRPTQEIAASQNEMLRAAGRDDLVMAGMAELLSEQYERTVRVLRGWNLPLLELDHGEVVKSPSVCAVSLADFIGPLGYSRFSSHNAAQAVDQALWRQRC